MARHTKITYAQALEVRELAQSHVASLIDIADAYGISPSHVCNIKAERKWLRDSTQAYSNSHTPVPISQTLKERKL